MATMADAVDIPSERLALHLQRQDIIALCQTSLPPSQYLVLGGQLAAIREQEVEYDLLELRLAGQRMQRSLTLAMLRDGGQIAEGRRIEQEAMDDRREAARVSGRLEVVIPGRVQEQVGGQIYEDDRITLLEEAGSEVASEHTLGATTIVESEEIAIVDSETVDANPEESFDCDPGSDNILGRYIAVVRAAESDIDEERVQCSICLDEFVVSETMNPSAPNCDHIWCRLCSVASFEAATHNEGSWPSQCCGEPIAVDTVKHFLGPSLIARYGAISVEWGTTNRTYCHEPRCSAFIAPDAIENRRATCPMCQLQTCSTCKGEYHDDTGPCSAREDQMVREVAQRNEWQQCPTCHRIIELSHGCNHITCFCATQFCYECAAIWKDCQCEQWRENRLYARAEVVALREGRGRNIEVVRRELLDQHECPHRGFDRVGGPGYCDECGDTLRDFLLRCQRCHMDLCRRCRQTRLRN